MGWRCMAAAMAVTAVILMSYGAVVVAEESRKDTNHQLEALEVNLRGRTFSRQKGAGQYWEDSSFADESQVNYDYFVQPILETTHQLPPTGEQTFISREMNNDSYLGHNSEGVTGTTDMKLDARKQDALQHDKTYSLYKQSSIELYQEEQTWPNKDPFSVFYDSMFPEMESVIPEEKTYNKNISMVPTKPTRESTSSTLSPPKPISLHEAAADSSPATLFTEVQSPTAVPVRITSISQLNTHSNSAPSHLNTSFDYTNFEKLITRMSLVLEKFGLSKAFTKKIFKEEEKFLNSLMHVKSLREKLNTISHHKLSAVTSKLNLSHLFSKLGLKDMASKIDLTDVASKLGLPDMASKIDLTDVASKLGLPDMASKIDLTDMASKLGLPDMVFRVNLTDLVEKFDIDDITYMVDLVEAASNLNLKDVASKMNIGHLNVARLLQTAVNQSHILAQIIDLESVHRAANILGINETFMDGVLNRVETSAPRYVSADDDETKLIYIPLFDTVSLNVVQTLGFTVLLFFLLLSAYSFISLKTDTVARDGSERPHVQQLPRPTSEWDLDSNRDWQAAVDATEAFNLPWEHNREHDEGEDQPDAVVPRRPIPVPDPGVLHRMSQHPSAHLRTHLQHTTRRGPLIVPVVNFHGDHHISHHHIKNPHTSHHQHVTARPHHHLSHLQPPHQPFIQHSVQPFAQPEPYEPDHYDKHRHFASYEDEYQHEGRDKDAGDYFLDDKYHQYSDPHSEADLPGTSDGHWYSKPTTRPTDAGNLDTHYRTTWQSQRRTTPQSFIFPTTAQPTTIINLTDKPTSLPNTRPTSKYAQGVTSSPSDKKGLNTRKINFTRE